MPSYDEEIEKQINALRTTLQAAAAAGDFVGDAKVGFTLRNGKQWDSLNFIDFVSKVNNEAKKRLIPVSDIYGFVGIMPYVI